MLSPALRLLVGDFRRVERVLERHEVFAGLERVENLLLFAELLVAVAGGLDGQADAAFALIDLDHARAHVLAGLEHVLDLVHALFRDLRDVDESINVMGQAHERTEARELRDLAGDDVADLVVLVNLIPRIRLSRMS